MIDNGAATCKAGFAGERDPVKVLPNYTSRAKGIKRQFVADEVDECDDIQVGLRICGETWWKNSYILYGAFHKILLRLYRIFRVTYVSYLWRLYCRGRKIMSIKHLCVQFFLLYILLPTFATSRTVFSLHVCGPRATGHTW